MTTRVIVPPASGRRESLAVLALALAIVAAAALVVGLHRDRGQVAALPGWQVDLRSGLNAAEQGLAADLLTAAPEFAWLTDTSPQALAQEGLAPFVPDATAQARGGHLWQALEGGGWLGLPADAGLARALLLRAGDPPSVWIAETATAPQALDDAALIAAGWRQVVTRFDASVTRKDGH
ncbi:MAG: DUF6162 family protein [Paracoccus sp. (in: a-proteobacteria)]|uniref:DUF6162 family protein n=1 Tax=Paracoccus sp. TaxID=267 RepID=UPI0039E4FB12